MIVSAAALALALAGIDLRRVGEALARARYSYLVPAGASMLCYLFGRAVRWRLLLGRRVSLVRAFWITCIGYLVSNVLPFRLGDPARAVVVGRDEAVSTAAALSTVVVERILDMMMVALMLAAVLPFVREVEWARAAGFSGGAVAVVALVLLVLFARWPKVGRRILRWGLARIPRIDGERRDRWTAALSGLLDGLASLGDPRRAIAICVWSVVTWAFVVGYYWAMLGAFLDGPSLAMGVFLTCAIGLGMAIPSAPGAVGVFHQVARYALVAPFAVLEEDALTVAFAAHAFQYLGVCVLGLVGLARESVSLGWVRARIAQEEKGDA